MSKFRVTPLSDEVCSGLQASQGILIGWKGLGSNVGFLTRRVIPFMRLNPRDPNTSQNHHFWVRISTQNFGRTQIFRPKQCYCPNIRYQYFIFIITVLTFFLKKPITFQRNLKIWESSLIIIYMFAISEVLYCLVQIQVSIWCYFLSSWRHSLTFLIV